MTSINLKKILKKIKLEKFFLRKTQNPGVAPPKVKTNISILKDALNKFWNMIKKYFLLSELIILSIKKIFRKNLKKIFALGIWILLKNGDFW